MTITNRVRNQHLLWRAAFGPMAENAAALDDISQKELWQLLMKTSAGEPEKLDVAKNMFDGLFKGVKDVVELEKAGKMNEDDKKERQKKMRQQSKDDLKNLNIRWLEKMINSEAQLREKMALFWHGHFSCRVINSYFQQELLHTIREHALGNFGDLLKAVSKSPAMLQFLNNQQNRKKKPNENFAREVMELFTMGRGHYTENDIKDAARAFTGWGFNLRGEFEFRQHQHDADPKTVLGKTGNFNGDDILNLLLQQKQTAKFICTKLYRYFVNEQVDEKQVNSLSDRFYENNYDIKKLLGDIFLSDWFYAEKNIGNRIKSPVELLAGIRRLLPLEMENDNVQILLQKVLGQILFYPPNVAGWPGGKSWIDSSTLLVRMQIPTLLASNENIDIRAKSDDDVNMGQMNDENMRAPRRNAISRQGGSNIQWEAVYKVFADEPEATLPDKITEVVLQSATRPDKKTMLQFYQSGTRELHIKTVILNLMKTPEYQLC